MKYITPARSIRLNCKGFCMVEDGNFKCNSLDCVFKTKGLSPLKKIRSYCKECGADHLPRECKGIVLNTEYSRSRTCPLHQYRFGKNPKLKGKTPSHLVQHLFKARTKEAIKGV